MMNGEVQKLICPFQALKNYRANRGRQAYQLADCGDEVGILHLMNILQPDVLVNSPAGPAFCEGSDCTSLESAGSER